MTKDNYFIHPIVYLAILAMTFMLGCFIGDTVGFRAGYISSLIDQKRGKPLYVLVENKDGSKTWTKNERSK